MTLHRWRRPIRCVHRVAMIDQIREKPIESIADLTGTPSADGRAVRLSVPVKVLTWMFAGPKSSPHRRIFTAAAMKLFGLK